MISPIPTTTDRTRRLAPSLDWVRARRREWQAGVGTGCGTERWRAAEDAGPIDHAHEEDGRSDAPRQGDAAS